MSDSDTSLPTIGVLGGSGLYELDGLEDLQPSPLTTPWGEPSAPPLVGRLAGRRIVFIPRHGRGHRYSPSEINYRANVAALKQLGASQVIAFSAVGSMREEIRPGDLVIVDQLIDLTHRRATTFFGEGCAGHVTFAEPVCPELGAVVAAEAQARGFVRPDAVGPRVHVGGTYLCMEGPQFSTRAESLLHRSWGVSVVGMTAAPEMKLCREAELCLTVVALATDYDCWHPEEAPVTAQAVVETLRANIAAAKGVLGQTLPKLPTPRRCACATAAAQAIMTSRDALTPAARERLQTLYGRSFDR